MEELTSLEVYCGKNIFNIPDLEVFSTLSNRESILPLFYFNGLFLLSKDPHVGMKPLQVLDYSKANFELSTTHIPTVYKTNTMELWYLYQLTPQDWLKYFSIVPVKLCRLKGFHLNRDWTKEYAKISGLEYLIKSGDIKIVLHTYGNRPDFLDPLKTPVRIHINGKHVTRIERIDRKLVCYLPPEEKMISSIELHTTTFNPKKLGMNPDSRDLGLDLKAIEIINAQQSQ